MRGLHVKWGALILILGFAACAADVPPQEADTVGVSENALVNVSVDGCPGKRPPIRGCHIACKPCLIPECVDGHWTYERIEWDGCNPDPLPGPACCDSDATGFCPAECHCCN